MSNTKKSKRWIKKLSWIVPTFMACLLLSSQIPYKVDGLYRAEPIYDCLCDCKHYLRIYKGKASIYSPGHNTARYLGEVVEECDGTYSIYTSSADGSEKARTVKIYRSCIGGLRVFVDHGDFQKQWFQIRVPYGEGHDAVEECEVKKLVKEGDQYFWEYMDKDYCVIRRERRRSAN